MTLKFPEELIINGTEWTYTPFRFNIHWINAPYVPKYRDITVTGYSPLNLPNAEAAGLRYIKLFGKCEQTPNLFDKDKATLNYYINPSGEEQYNASWACSDYIEVKEGCVYNLSGVSSYGSSPRTGFYAADKSFVSSRSQSSADFTIPDGVKYMRVSIYRSSIDTATVKQILTLDKYTIVGTPTFNGDVVSGFSSSNYITVGTFQPLSNTWEIAGKFNAQSAGATQIVFARTKSTYFGVRMMISQAAKISLEASSNGTSNMISVTSDSTINYNTDYWFRVKFNGTQYIVDLSTDNSTWTNYITVDESTTIYDDSSNLLQIGAKANQYFRGSIDLKEFKITINNTTTQFLGTPIPIMCNNGVVGSAVRLPETVRILGKNLFDQTQLLNATDWSLNSDGYYNGLFSNYNAKFTSGFEIDVPFKEKTVYTLSCKGYVSDEGSRARFVFVYTDETSKSLTIDGTSSAEYTLTTTSTKTLAKIRGTYASGASSTLYLKDIQLEEGSSATAFQPYYASPTAVAQDLLSCGDDYVDEQNITTGEITRKVGYLILNGTENWGIQDGYTDIFYLRTGKNSTNPNTCICTWFKGIASSSGVGILTDGDIKYGYSSQLDRVYIRYSAYANNLTGFKTWLAAKYASGEPVIVVFPKETATTESATAQTGIQTVSGLNTLYITQSAIDGLAMEVTYSAGVEVTIEEVQAANVDQTVEVTIGE